MKTKHYILFCVLLFAQNFTAQEISLLKDINPGTSNSNSTNFKVFDGNLYFTANNKTFISDGTEQETNELSTNLRFSSPNKGVDYDGKLYFSAEFQSPNEGAKGQEICVLNNGIISLIQDINPDAANADIDNLIEHNGMLYFSANNGTNGRELWIYDPTTNVASLLKNIRDDSNSIAGSSISNMTVHNNLIYFTAQETTSKNELWKTNGTEGGTVKVAVITENNKIGTDIDYLIDFNGELYFSANEENTSKELWSYNSSTQISRIVKDIRTGNLGSSPKNFIEFDGELLFTASSEQQNGDELYKTDGTEGGTIKVKRLNPDGNATVYINTAFEFGEKLFFVAKKETSAFLFSTNGIAEETLEINEVADGSNAGIDNFKPVSYNNKIYFRGTNSDGIIGIWETSGNPNEAKELTTNTLTGSYEPEDFIVFYDKLFFTAQNSTFGNEIFTLTTGINEETTAIPDDAFEQFLIDQGIDSGELDDQVLTANISSLTSLNLNNLSITDLTGIQDFEALQELILDGNTGLTFDLSSNNNLTKLSLNSMNLNEFESFNYSFLQELSINNNNLTSFDTNSLYQITHLDCSFNQIEILKLFNLTQLQELVCNNNDIERLDFSNLTSVTNIIVNNNALENLNIKTDENDYTKIQDFNATNNPNLTCIDVINAAYATTNYTNIDEQTSFSENCATSATTYVPDDAFEQYLIDQGYDSGELDDYVLTSNINTIAQLFIENKGIKTLEGIQDFTQLQQLDCSNNLINRLNLNNLNNIFNINVSNNELYEFKLNVGSIQVFHSTGNTNLNCIEVDNLNATNNFAFNGNPDFSKDEHSYFSENCPSLYTYVPDDNFEEYLITLEKDDVLDDYVLTANINQIEELTMIARGIKDLTGIEDFEALKNLDVASNLLTEVNVNSNSNLETLNISSNQLTNLHTRSNLKLETVNAAFNKLTTVNLSLITKILDVNTNEFTTLNLTGMVYLEELNCKSNSNLSELILTSTPSIKEIQASFCGLSTIDLSGNNQLINLDVSYNNISNLDLRNSLGLETVQCRNNEMETLLINSNRNSNKLKSLIARNNNLTALDLSGADDLEELWVNDNNLSSLNLKNGAGKLSKLTVFTSVRNADLTCIDVDDVAYADANLTSIDNHTSFYINCNFFGGDYVYMPDDNFEQYFINNNLDDTLDDFVLKSNIENIETLSLSLDKDATNKIEDLTGIEAFSNLKQLIMNYNAVENLDLSSNLLLEIISVIENGLKTVTLPETATLTSLDFFNNELSTIDVSFLSNLKRLVLTVNQLNIIDVSNNILLEDFYISNNNIENIDVSTNTKLKFLTVSFMGENTFMGLESLDVSSNIFLENLNIKGNNLSVLDITNNIRLTDFEARANNLTCINVWDVDFANTNWSDNIDAEASFGDSCYTAIPDEKFEEALIDKGLDSALDGYVVTSTIEAVSVLNIQSSEITDLTGIQNFTALTSLSLKGNNLESVDLSNNIQLKNLNVINNKLDRLDISNNTSLTSLEATSNNLTCIKVWDTNYANNNWSDKIDATATFSIDCDEVWTVEVDEKAETIIITIPGIDKNNDGKITLKEAKEFVGELDLSDKNIDDIKGLQAFSSIKSLNLSGNNIKDLSALTGKKIILVSKTTGKKREVAAKASGLETLIISNNSFETLNLEALKNLKIIDVSNNPNLGTMSIKNGNNASITSFNASNSTNLSCIIVDDKNAAYLSTFSKDPNSNFVADLADCRSAVLLTEEFLQKDLNVFPNPVTNFLNIESSKEFDYIEIYNSIGKRILKTTAANIDFSSYTCGIYMIRIIAEQKVLTKKIIKK
jgi:ELWxxDGT repeat protein